MAAIRLRRHDSRGHAEYRLIAQAGSDSITCGRCRHARMDAPRFSPAATRSARMFTPRSAPTISRTSRSIPNEMTVPQLLKQRGYKSALFGKFHVGIQSNNPYGYGMVRALGWDYFEAGWTRPAIPRRSTKRPAACRRRAPGLAASSATQATAGQIRVRAMPAMALAK